MAELFRQAAGLPENDRAALAGLLIESLDRDSESGAAAAWIDEVQRRIADMDSGAVKTLPWQNVRAKLFRLLDES